MCNRNIVRARTNNIALLDGGAFIDLLVEELEVLAEKPSLSIQIPHQSIPPLS